MAYYTVADITQRRINDDSGTVEYAVKWEGFEGETTWERRQHLTENCAEMVQAVDQRCMDATDDELARWRRREFHTRSTSLRQEDEFTTKVSSPSSSSPPPPPLVRVVGLKRSRSPSLSATPSDGKTLAKSSQTPASEAVEDAEVLSGLLLRHPAKGGVKTEGDDETSPHTEEGTVLMLGEVVLAEETTSVLNKGANGGAKKRKQNAERAVVALNTAPALEVEKLWRDMHGQSLLHSVEVAHSVTPFRDHFHLRQRDDDGETQRVMAQESSQSSHLRILDIAPPLTSYTGAIFSAPVSLDGLVGERDVEEMRLSVQLESPLYAGAAQELVKPHVEQMVVRYIVFGDAAEVADASPRRAVRATDRGRVACMPLSVFRLAFPQLLIDYLLENSVVLH